MSTNDFQKRARNALMGLALGDAVGWPAMHHRSRLLPSWTRRLRRDIEAQRDDAGVIRVPIPFSLNQPAEVFRLSPTDDTEWAAWTMQRLLRTGALVTAEAVTRDWKELAARVEKMLGGVSTQSALENLRRGILPPASGKENPHYFDDGALCRAVPIGIAYPGHPEAAARAAEREASVTNAEDGLWAASAVAAAVSLACAGASRTEALEGAMRALPHDSWIHRIAKEALLIPRRDVSRLELLYRLNGFMNVEYSDGCVGPESLAVILAIVAREELNLEEALLSALAIPRGADAIPAIVGGITGAFAASDDLIPAVWTEALSTLRGICLPFLEGESYVKIVDAYVAACSTHFTPRKVR